MHDSNSDSESEYSSLDFPLFLLLNLIDESSRDEIEIEIREKRERNGDRAYLVDNSFCQKLTELLKVWSFEIKIKYFFKY